MARSGRWQWLSDAAVVAVVVLIMAAGAFYCVPDIQSQRRLQQRKIELEGQIQRLEKEITILDFRIRQLDSDPNAIERAARAWLGYARPGEAVIYWVPASGPESAPLPPPADR